MLVFVVSNEIYILIIEYIFYKILIGVFVVDILKNNMRKCFILIIYLKIWFIVVVNKNKNINKNENK